MNPTKSLMIQQVMSPASALVSTDNPAGQYQRGLDRSQGEKAVKITKAVKIATRTVKQRIAAKAACLPAPLFSPHSSRLSDLPSKPKYQYYVYPP